MLPAKYRRLWKRRLRRRPLLPFLLAAAITCHLLVFLVDWEGESISAPYAVIGLLFGLIHLLGVWVSSRRHGVFMRSTWALLATCGTIGLLSWALPDPPGAVLAIGVVVLVLATAVSALLQAIAFRYREGMARRYQLRYSIGLLLAATTATPFLLWGMRSGRWQVLLDASVFCLVLLELLPLVLFLSLSLATQTPRLSTAALSLLVVILGFFSVVLPASLVVASPVYYLGITVSIGGMLTALQVRGRTPITKANQSSVVSESEESIDLQA